MKGRYLEKAAAVFCALALAVGVMSSVVFARDEEPTDEPSAPEATFVVVDLDLDASPADADDAAASVEASDTEAYVEAVPALEITDNRSSVPLYVNDSYVGECPIIGGVPWADAESFCRALGLDVSASVLGGAFTMSGAVSMTASADDIYFVFNNRCILVEDGVIVRDGQALFPVELLAKCLGVSTAWDRVRWTVEVTADSVYPLENGDTYYDETNLYWLSRVIYAEAGSQSLLGQIAVGNVVMNRISDESFVDQSCVYDVIFAKNQFEVVINGMIYMEPSESARIAAKIALEGYDVSGGATYFATFDFGEGYECIQWIGDHCFMIQA